ncbi:hypothetical protein [Streptomyces europaeiscabiei]|uniref:Integral membrane protein n=1 Tax=Streptomyces europaeiscabiei TaxID=146819 RepID=A0ABU4NJX3_9ACTN|nr:hypothetical protein [Streptomyces europaeiscabiei]MDX2528835.1 hypothetical protein [Streptomyces europaeiscabiei]MDX2763118.1 hypothetical protein [Streptomyces europaeiscabiei]MDX3548083.1 hypothetical protein [Streptomyces europaeiscabiei]MDX3556002.1 hypothetical protein [Streptomyces europaeiscabiei]MDX3669670.1 hypothetical protein [Streptomyces europaeiscabiei]
MGTKTVDETGADTGAEARNDDESVKGTDVTKDDAATEEAATATGDSVEAGDSDETGEFDEEFPPAAAKASPGVGQGAAGIVSVVLGLVSLTGGWVGTVASARAEITGQIEMQAATNATVATQLQAVYGDAWQASALWGGIFALVGLLVGVAVLVRPAFGDPDQVQTPWIKSVAWAGVAVGFIGLVLAALKYSDILLGLPST